MLCKNVQVPMEKYPKPTRCRIPVGDSTLQSSQLVVEADTNAQPSATRSKLRPPSAGLTPPRPKTIQLTKGTDSNGNMARSPNLPTCKGVLERPLMPLLSLNQPTVRVKVPVTQLATALEQINTEVPKQPTAVCTGATGATSPSPTISISSRSTIKSNRSNGSTSLEDSGIASAAISPTISERKSALSLRFGFQKPAHRVGLPSDASKSALNTLNMMHHQLEKDQRQQHHVGKILNLKSPKEKNPITDRPQRLRSLFNSPTSLIKTPPSGNIAQKMVKKGQKGTPHAGRALPAIQGKIPDRSTSSSLEKMKSRAALVLNQPSSLSSTVPSQMKPRMSIEAIVASLESEMRYQFGEDPPQLVVPIPVEAVTETSNTTRIAPRPLEAESMFTESATVEYIANISPIETPSSICTTAMSHTSP